MLLLPISRSFFFIQPTETNFPTLSLSRSLSSNKTNQPIEDTVTKTSTFVVYMFSN